MSIPMLVKGLVNRFKPASASDNTSLIMRMDRYGNVVDAPVYDSMLGAAEDGSLFLATNPTSGTPLAVTTSITAYAETAGAIGFALLLQNIGTGDSAKRIIPLQIKLPITQVPTSATSWQYVLLLTNNPAFYTSGGSALTPVCTHSDVPAGSSVARVYFGALTTGVPGSDKRYVGRGNLRGIIPTTFDEMTISFRGFPTTGLATSGSMRNVVYNDAVVIGPGYTLALSMFGAANAAAPSFEPTISWIER